MLTLNPGFPLLACALLLLAAPRALRPWLFVGAALAALWLLLDHEFGAAAAMAQMGLPVVLLDLDELNRVFGIAMLLAAIVLGVFIAGRPNRHEDAAIALAAGGAISALFMGDLISFAATAALSSLGAAWVVFASPRAGAGDAGVRVLIWSGLEGLLLLVGVALRLSSGAENSMLSRLGADTAAGGFILAALLVRAGAPLAHVWIKDAIVHASAPGAAALAAFPSVVGVYAIARFFPAEPTLLPIGAAMMAIGLLYAGASGDLRRASAYAFVAQCGIALALLGLGTPLGLAAAEAHIFAQICSLVALQLALGCVEQRAGADLQGLAARMPLSATLLLAAGLAVAAAPGASSYAALTLALEAAATFDWRWLWAFFALSSAALSVVFFIRPAASIFSTAGGRGLHEAPYAMLLAATLAVFFCFAVGVAPGWLWGLLPGELAFQPFALDRLARQMQVLGGAGLVAIALGVATVRLRAGALPDVDTFYRGPLAAAGRWCITVMFRVQGAADEAGKRAVVALGRSAFRALQNADRPYAGHLALGLWLGVGAAACIALWFTAR